ncbi:MAG: endonuclease MutS2 [Jaaginema sp. PMC 1079.18]|nr:endonuclease MutS2 [Jaaginema sp. PMC 1080.18]MEC4853258.1 endonuclease MutS2 [Jaaginema sp. PMC 1079.18]MEC4868959.1 endonuclease MutS2 [Jaaginema sp. PMC 1078.18]
MIQAETLELLEWPRLCQHLSTFAATKLGAIASQNLQFPGDRAASRHLLTQTQEVYNLELRLDNGLTFTGIQDIGDSLERVKRQGILSGEELLAIATTLAGMRRLRRVIDEQEEIPTLQEIVEPVRTYPELEQEIHRCIDDRAQVADRASQKLGDLRIESKQLRSQIQQKLQRLMQQHGNAIQQQVISQRGDRYVIPVKAPQKDVISGIVHDTSSTGATLYIEPNSIVNWGNQLRQILRQEKREEEAILTQLSAQVAEVGEDLEELLAIATQLDLATAKARYSLWLEANPPRFTATEEDVVLRQLRHPLLVWQEKHEQGQSVVPIDVVVRPPVRVVAITGPNTGGKTVTLKTLGIAALMAKVGLFIPAREPVEMPWFEQVLADIGDEQSLEQSLSTFSGHIRRISLIIEALKQNDTPQSLVLLDEVGAGTDPAEGSALAIALLYELADTAQLAIATTHYGELKALKYQDNRFENASVEFDEKSLQPTYRLLWGIPGRSNALTIARRLGLKAEIIDSAQSRMGGFSEDINQTIAGLEKERKRQEDRAREAADLLAQTERFYQEVSDRAAELQAREQELKLNQEKEINNAIATAKGEIAQVIRQLQQGKQTAQDAQKATESLNRIAERQRPKSPPKPSYKPKIGEIVRIPRLNQTAEILEVSEDSNNLIARFGIMKMTLPVSDIESLDGQKVEPPPKAKTPASKTPPPPKTRSNVRTSQNTLDIRGSRVANAEPEIEAAINNALASGTLWIIHGKGTGRLREGVQDFLQRHPQVERFELAPQNEGGSGVTVAYLR